MPSTRRSWSSSLQLCLSPFLCRLLLCLPCSFFPSAPLSFFAVFFLFLCLSRYYFAFLAFSLFFFNFFYSTLLISLLSASLFFFLSSSSFPISFSPPYPLLLPCSFRPPHFLTISPFLYSHHPFSSSYQESERGQGEREMRKPLDMRAYSKGGKWKGKLNKKRTEERIKEERRRETGSERRN